RQKPCRGGWGVVRARLPVFGRFARKLRGAVQVAWRRVVVRAGQLSSGQRSLGRPRDRPTDPSARLGAMSFTGKSVIVTGATSGIGRATATAFGREGAAVVVVGRQDADVAAAGDAVIAAGGRAAGCSVDLRADDAPDRIVRAAIDAFGGLDVLVNAAGIIASGALDATTDDMWDTMMAVNLRAPFRLMRAAAPHLAARKGTIVNVSSVN